MDTIANSGTPIYVRNTDSRKENLRNNLLNYLYNECNWEAIKNYKLPQHPTKDNVYVIPVSGGKDSTALILVLQTLFPEVKFIPVFTDTKAEPADIYDNLIAIENFTGLQIKRLSHPLGLFGYIEHYNGYLPNAKARYCTVELKIKIIDNWFKETFDYTKEKVYTFVGFTFEEDRIGMITDEEEVQSVFPFIDMKINVEKVFGILEATLGISSTYKTKSRSGCFCCPFLRRYEKVMMLFDRPNEYDQSKQYEKLTDLDVDRFSLNHNELIRNTLYGPTSIRLSDKQGYYLPPAVDVRTEFEAHSDKPVIKRLRDKATKNADTQFNIFDILEDNLDELEEEHYMYVAVGYWVTSVSRDYFSDMSYSGLYNTEFATLSRNLTGLKRSLHFWVEHKLSVAPLYGMNKEQMLKDLKIGLFQIKVNKDIAEVLKDPSDDSYTWSQSESYLQLETLTRLANSVLVYEGWQQFWDIEYAAKYDKVNDEELDFINSYALSIRKQLNKFKNQYENLEASIEWSGAFPLPSEDDINQMQMDAIMSNDKEFKASGSMACAICSI